MLPVIFIAVLFVLLGITSIVICFKETKEMKEKVKKAENEKIAMEKAIENYNDFRRKNEELIKKATSGNNDDAFSASVKLVQNIAKEGQKRNKN